jgi:ASC-1-like (ASCH) protein
MKEHTVSFKCYPYFWELSKAGKKPWEARLYDSKDERFKTIQDNWWKPQGCWIELVNTETKEVVKAKIYHYDTVSEVKKIGNWVVIYFRKPIPKQQVIL